MSRDELNGAAEGNTPSYWVRSSGESSNRGIFLRKLRAYTGYLFERIRRLSKVPGENRASITIAGQYVVPNYSETYVSQPLISKHLDELKKVGFTDEDIDTLHHVVWVPLHPRDVPGFLGAKQEPTWAVLASTDTGRAMILDGYIHDRQEDDRLAFVGSVSESEAKAARDQGIAFLNG